MKYQITVAALAALLNIIPGRCYGEILEAQWWSSQAAASNINPANNHESVRLWNSTNGFVEGTLNLPSSNRWVASFSANADEDPIRITNDSVRVFLNGALIGEYRNTPARAAYAITYPFNGDRLQYRFEFSSSTGRYDLHQSIRAGIITDESNVRIAGRVNDFGWPPTPASPSPELAQILLASNPNRLDFDQVFPGDSAFGHTFANIPPDTEGAVLWLRVLGFCCQTYTDVIEILFSDSENNTYDTARTWLRSLGLATNAIGTTIDPGLAKNTAWAIGDVAIIKLDLSALPLVGGGTTNLVEVIKTKGFFDIVVRDDSVVDYAVLDLTPKQRAPLGLEIQAVDIQTELGKTYQVQVSENLTNWVNWGAPFVGNGETGFKVISTQTASHKFYRVIERH